LTRQRAQRRRRGKRAVPISQVIDGATDAGQTVHVRTAGNEKESHMLWTRIAPLPTLRHALRADAAVSSSLGLLQVAGGSALVALLGLPQALVLGSGLFMLVYVVALVGLARASALRGLWVAIIVVGNFAWADACVALWALDVVSPTPLGTAWLLMQAVVVTTLAVWQGIGWRVSQPLRHDGAERESGSLNVAR
jgi:hypothetical protein